MTILKQVLAKIWQGMPLNGDDIVALCLLAAMVMSLGHLLTMLATKWGDRHIAVKSLLGSLLVHTVCLLGLEVFDPLVPEPIARITEVTPPPDVVTEILVESDNTVALRESGNTPVPDMPTPPDVELQRLPQDARLMENPEVPDREQEVLDSLQADVEDVSRFEQAAVPESANPVDSGREAPREAAANDVAADVETMQEQSTNDIYVPQKERLRTQNGDVVPDTSPAERRMSAGSVPQVDTNIVTDDTSIVTATTNSPDSIALPSPTESEEIRRKRGPVTGSNPDDIAGLSADVSSKRTVVARSFESRLPRPFRTLRSPAPGKRPVRQTSRLPQTPIPLTSDYDEVRIGMTTLNLTDALRSAAAMVDSNVHSVRRRATRPATYKLRNLAQRKDTAAKFGGTSESEAAVELSLQWLGRMQSADGHWDAEKYGAGQIEVDENNVKRDYAGRDSDTGITALVTLSFLGAGYTHEEGKYALNVDRALDWIIKQQKPDGSLSGEARHYAKMYCHAMATYALAEALGMQNEILLGPIVDPAVLSTGPFLAQGVAGVMFSHWGLIPHAMNVVTNTTASTQADMIAYNIRQVDEIRLRAALLKAITYTISQQDPRSGGWRYKPGQEGDVSMFGWQMMSLKSAAIAGVSIHPKVRQNMIKFLNSVRQGDNGGLFGYRRSVKRNGRETEPVSPVMTAEALFCQQMLGYPRDSAASREAIRYLEKNMPRLSELNMYYWYYGTLAMYQYGGQPWENWNRVVRDTLISEQRRDGDSAGSWNPTGPWGPYGGRLYSTAISTLTLEVYYRLLPLYRMNEEVSGREQARQNAGRKR